MSEASPALIDPGASIVPGVSPQLYSQTDFERIARLVHQEAGIVLSQGKAMLAYSRIAPLVRASSANSFSEYLEDLDKSPTLKTRTIAVLTTNHTYFNREPHHYEHFASHVRPALLERAAARMPVRLWSAGCSSGEEVWTLMMVLLGTDRAEGLKIANHDILTLASDLADHAVSAAEEGRYPNDAMNAVPEPLRTIWCDNASGELSIGSEVRRLVRFRRLNLLRSWPLKGKFDVIFCRNVMIYFDEPTKERLVLRFAQQLRPGGFLYIGHSERVSGEADSILRPVGPTIYQKSGGSS
ncbi:MAG: protein-glutamate O-methyltransferase CheR [Pseudomonadota bacterium]